MTLISREVQSAPPDFTPEQARWLWDVLNNHYRDLLRLDSMNTDFYTEVAKGNVPGHSLIRKFGNIEGVTAGIDYDVWEYGSIGTGVEKYTFSSTADINKMTSDDNTDTESITIIGLDTDGVTRTQTLALTGQTEVVIPIPLWRVNRVYNSNGTPTVGNVYVFTGASTAGVPDTDTNVRGYFSIVDQQTLQGPYTVDANCNAYVVGLEASMLHAGNPSGTVNVNCKGIVREFGKVFRTQDEFDLIHRGASSKNYNFPIPLPFPSKADFLPQINSNTSGVGVSWSYTILLVEEGF